MATRSGWVTSFGCLLAVGLLAGTAAGQNLLLNGGFEDPAGITTNWIRETGSLNGTGLGESARTGLHSWHGAWNYAGSAQTTTYYQDVTVSPSEVVTASMWCKANAWGGSYGNDTHSFQLTLQFLNASNGVLQTHTLDSPQPNDTYQGLAIYNKTAPATAAKVRVKFSYITTQMANAWKTWNVDDVSLTSGGVIVPAVLTSINPAIIADNSQDTYCVVSGTALTGVTSVKLVQGAAELDGSSLSIAPDGLSLSATFLTQGAAPGYYNVVATKTGVPDAVLTNGFAIRDPSANLLLNGDFEANADAVPNPMNWIKYDQGWGAMDNRKVTFFEDPPNSDPTEPGEGSTIHYPAIDPVEPSYNTTRQVFDNYCYAEYESGGGGSSGIYQDVDVIPGENLTLSWWWTGGSTATTPYRHAVVIKPTTDADPWNNYITYFEYRYDTNPNPGFGWLQEEITFSVPMDLNKIRIMTSTWYYNGNQVIATYVDDFVLRPAAQCTNPITISGVTRVLPGTPGTVTLALSGSNLDGANGVRLARGSEQYTGVIDSAATGSLQATFTLPVDGITVGNYAVVVEQSGCTDVEFSDALVLDITGLDYQGMNPIQLSKPQGVIEAVVTGSNVDLIGEVKLRFQTDTITVTEPRPDGLAPQWVPEHDVPGAIVDASDPDNVVMAFDMQNARVLALYNDGPGPNTWWAPAAPAAFMSPQAGLYDLIGVRPNNKEFFPVIVEDVLELTLPTEGTNLLGNPDFEDGVIDPWVITPAEGTTDKGDPFTGPELVDSTGGFEWYGQLPQSGNFFVGQFAYNDGNYGSWFSPNDGYLEQTVSVPNGSGDYRLTAAFWFRMWDQRMPTAYVEAQIIADLGLGTELVGPVVKAQMRDSYLMNGFDAYTLLSVDFIGTASQTLTLRFHTYTVAGGDAIPYSVVAIDNVSMVTSSAFNCPTPFADADEDGDVDQDDFAVMQRCLTGGTGSISSALVNGVSCTCFDTDADEHVTAFDVAAFEACSSGPSVPWVSTPGCP